MEKKTPLYDRHVALGGKIVPFAGYLLPVQYPTGVIAEHMAVRTAAGLFDVSHMGELVFTGPDALQNLNHMLTNDFTNMTDGQVRYSPMCNDAGGCVDDLIVYIITDPMQLDGLIDRAAQLMYPRSERDNSAFVTLALVLFASGGILAGLAIVVAVVPLVEEKKRTRKAEKEDISQEECEYEEEGDEEK